MKELFVPYELALLAKEKGFNKRCLGVYNDTNEEKIKFSIDSDGIRNDDILGGHHNIQGFSHTTAPLYQQLVDWFREKHSIEIIIDPAFRTDKRILKIDYMFSIRRLYIKNGNSFYRTEGTKDYISIVGTKDCKKKTYHDVLESALKIAFEKI